MDGKNEHRLGRGLRDTIGVQNGEHPTAGQSEALRDWHRLFGLLLTDFFSGSSFVVEVERDLSFQQQFLDVVIVRRSRGRFDGPLPDGLEGLRAHNLITFKSHREALDSWAMKELIGHNAAHRKLVSRSPSELVDEDQFGLYAVTARSPNNLRQVPWQQVEDGAYDCKWGVDTVRVIVAGELSREPNNAPLHLFSASPELVGFGGRAYQPRSSQTSRLLGQLFERLQREGFAMPFTMEDSNKQYIKEHFPQLTPEERKEVLKNYRLKSASQICRPRIFNVTSIRLLPIVLLRHASRGGRNE